MNPALHGMPSCTGENIMDTKQIEYILKIAEENNITKAAGKLYITQSALNQQLIKLEKELGTPLFHRSRTNWHLTFMYKTPSRCCRSNRTPTR